MSTKAKKVAKAEKSEKQTDRKAGKLAANAPEMAAAAPEVDPDELEEQEDAAAAASGGGGNAAALAAASGPSEMSASFKNFRHHPDMENFYRFIYDNDLRQEALTIIDEIMLEKQKRKQLKSAKSHAH